MDEHNQNSWHVGFIAINSSIKLNCFNGHKYNAESLLFPFYTEICPIKSQEYFKKFHSSEKNNTEHVMGLT